MPEWLIAFVREGGGYCAVLELLAIGWLLTDRKRILADNAALTARVNELAETITTVATELKSWLFFNERKG